MEYNYDSEADVLLMTLSKESPYFGEQRENIITHYDNEGRPVEIEILNASSTASKIIETMFGSKKKP